VSDSSFLTRVVLSNYRSIAACDVRLGPLTFLVGPNGSGKSSFLDALRFVTDGLRRSLDHALRERGGMNEVRRRSGGHPTHFGVRLEFIVRSHLKHLATGANIPPGLEELLFLSDIEGHYAFKIAARPQGGYEVQAEQCFLFDVASHERKAFFVVHEGQLSSSIPTPFAVQPDRLTLVALSGIPAFRPVYDALSNMGFYSLNPDRIRDLQSPDPGELLARDGSNLAGVLARLVERDPRTKDRIEEYLSQVVPGVVGVDARQIGPKETLEFRQQVAGSKAPWRFLAANMSDGTLRALGILVALFQSALDPARRVRLVGIEEPEVALHPAAAGILRDSLRDASSNTQIIVTSHSPDLLDDERIPADAILAVTAEAGTTRIGALDEADRSALRDHLYTAGELLRLGALTPQRREGVGPTRPPQLFDPVPA
jgi:predicted ATPase